MTDTAAADTRLTDLYLIWSNEHEAWLAPMSRGYRKSIRLAGLYERSEAIQNVAEATAGQWPLNIPNELPIRIGDLPPDAIAFLTSVHTETERAASETGKQ